MTASQFDAHFRQRLGELLSWRRDVRRFRRDPLEPHVLDRLLDLACLAPSVGNSQPWRFVRVDHPTRRSQVLDVFRRCDDAALAMYAADRAATRTPP